MKRKSIPISSLLVDTENYRFEPVQGQKEAIDVMVKDQKEKLYALAVDILQKGLNPTDLPIVTPAPGDPSKYVVLEGNRRLIALKILQTPDLIDDDKQKNLRKKFNDLHNEYKDNLPEHIESAVVKNREEAEPWIALKHMDTKGEGTIKWTSQQKQRYLAKLKGTPAPSIQVLDILRNSPETPKELKERLGEVPRTNLDRLIADPKFRKTFGIDVDKGVLRSNFAKKDVIGGLIAVVQNLLDGDVTVKNIYKKEDRANYIKNLPEDSKPDLKNTVERPWQYSVSASASTVATKKKRVQPRLRRSMIPRDCEMDIDNPKINAMYHELQRLRTDEFTHVASVSLRVFVELSADCYIERNKLEGVHIDSSLISKILAVANDLEKRGLASKHVCKGIRSAMSAEHNVLGTKTLNAYIHNPDFSATPTDLIVAWDNIQKFMEKLWENTSNS